MTGVKEGIYLLNHHQPLQIIIWRFLVLLDVMMLFNVFLLGTMVLVEYILLLLLWLVYRVIPYFPSGWTSCFFLVMILNLFWCPSGTPPGYSSSKAIIYLYL